ncbi:hypothetical protein [Fusobacterium sp.]|uniref:hypothetical protein n=1 Tax=Fusobacterium sp. TaxID=68766 RepID=UPI0025C0A1D6|nr:hypothetical protein [Fusobacterium sp.]MCI7224505.1 hypothetical protein [Fusobacterium sp.]
MDYNINLFEKNFELKKEEVENNLMALCTIHKTTKEQIIKNGILTSIAYETMPNYKNYTYIISGITQARMIKGVKSKRNHIDSQIEKILELYDIEEVNKDILDTAVNLVIMTFDSVFQNSKQKTRANYEKVLNDIEFLYINLKLAVKITAETLRRQNIQLSNLTLQYITDAIKKEKKNIAETYIEAYINGNEEDLIIARSNYRERMESMLNEYYKTIMYNYEHATMIGQENQILKVLGKDFFDITISILLNDMKDTIMEKHSLQTGFMFQDTIR